MGEGMPLGAECALRARRLAASDPYQPADPRQGRQVYRAGGGGGVGQGLKDRGTLLIPDPACTL